MEDINITLNDKILNSYKGKNEEFEKFRELTQKNIETVESSIKAIQEKCSTYETTINNIKELAKHPRHKSYIKICSLAYIEAFVNHTGEYNVTYSPDYQATLTKDQTIEYLEEQLTGERGNLNMFIAEKDQLERRLGYDFCESDDVPDVSEMPESILSDKGMAFKRGNFFEIVEEDDEPYLGKSKRISKVKKEKPEIDFEGLKLDDIKDVNERAEMFLNFIEK
nr:uncharacterized protein LOC111428563 [Onthophagus taurus]